MTVYLSGAVVDGWAGMEDRGFMLTPMIGNRVDLTATLWAADTGLFAAPTRFRLARYLAWLVERQPYTATCLFATAPDVVGDARATWRDSKDVLPVLRALGFRAALVAQNGIHGMRVRWDTFDALFIGGDDAFKLSEQTYALVADAKRRGKHTHMGRVNGEGRFFAAALSHYDSADGTCIKYGPDVNRPKVERWLERQRRQSRLPLYA